MPRNVLMILTDQHRYDIVGANGSRVCQSPSLDALAASGVNFSRAYSVCPLCTPARASIYSGLLPHRHGLTRNVMADDPNPRCIPESIPTLGERMRDAGYDAHFLGKWHAGDRMPTDAGFTGIDVHGYGKASDHPDYHAYLAERGLDAPTPRVVGRGWAHDLTLAGVMSGPVEASVPCYLAERAREYLRTREDADRPFFLALNFWGPHAPYLPSEPYASMIAPRDIPPWGNFADTLENKPPIYRRYRDAFIGEGNAPRTWEECARWAALYFGFAMQIDAQIGRVLAELDALGMADDTAVLFSTDHGDLCGSHGGMHDKDGVGSQAIYHIPLMGRVPGGAAGVTCGAPVSNMDLSRTVLELGGAEIPEDIDGCSLLPALEGRDDADRPDFVVGEFYGNHFAYEVRVVVHGDMKYVFHPGATDELYDLAADPNELTNLIDDPARADALRACRTRLLDWMKDTKDDLCLAAGLFHQRLGGPPAPYGVGAMDRLASSPTKLIE